MNAVVQRQDEGALAVVQDMSGGLLEVIARAARDPNVDISKMERLFELQERVQDRNAKVAYQTALAEMQPRLPVISERGKILNRDSKVQSTYAFWEDVNEHIKPLLAEFGFSLSFRCGRAGQDITVTGILAHRDGHSEDTTMSLPADGSGSKNAVQAVASSTSYGKRYTAFALLNITTKGEDDDGVGATYKDARGTPMPRTVLDGKYTSKTALRGAINEAIAKARKAGTLAELNAVGKEYADAIAQAERDWLELLTGRADIEEDTGLYGAVHQRKAELSVPSMLETMIDRMKQCSDHLDLGEWLEKNNEAIEGLSDADARVFQREHDAFDAGLTAVARVKAG